MNTRKNRVTKLLMVALFMVQVIHWNSCRAREKTIGDSNLNQILEVSELKQPENMADWIRLQHKQIQARTIYLNAIKVMAKAIDSYKKGVNNASTSESLSLSGTVSPTDIGSLQRVLVEQADQIQKAGTTIKEIDMTMDDRIKIANSATNAIDTQARVAKQAAEEERMKAELGAKIFQQEQDNAIKWAQTQAQLDTQYTELANKPIEQWIKNSKGGLENQRLAVDNEGARIENFGKMLRNESLRLDNVLKSYEILLKSYYSIGYRRYVQSYNIYTNNIELVWNKIGQNTQALGHTFSNMKNYNRQSAICESRQGRLLRHKYLQGNEELRGKEVRWSNVASTLDDLASSAKREECLHKVLLTSQYLDSGELFNIGFNVSYSDGKKLSIACPTIVGVAPAEGIDSLSYPPVQLDLQTHELLGLYQPVTYYQLFKLITENEAQVSVSAPLSGDKSLCPSHHPGLVAFKNESRNLEKRLSETLAVNATSSRVPDAGYVPNFSGIPTSNKSYRTFVSRMTEIFRRVEACEALEGTPNPTIITAPSGVPVTVPNTAPVTPAKPTMLTDAKPTDPAYEAGKPAKSELNTYFDPDFPEMSESVRECMRTAEHYRYKAFSELEVYDKMYSILQKATEMKPPRAPHPTQFTPATAGPLTNPGNN